MKPIPDRAEVALDFPDKAYLGSFGRSENFEVRAAADQVVLKLVRDGADRRVIEMHLHLALLAEILNELALELKSVELDDIRHQWLFAAATALKDSLERRHDGGQ